MVEFSGLNSDVQTSETPRRRIHLKFPPIFVVDSDMQFCIPAVVPVWTRF